ncbi:MAG TPA: DUF6712 family protein [Paludibacter sp.]|nr:DUF6712 family protein [Paludibacter sp.]
MIFNKNNTGGTELRDLIGFIDASTNFDRWKTWIELSVRQITSLTGTELYKLAETHYNSDKYGAQDEDTTEGETAPKYKNSVLTELVRLMQLTNALFAYVKLLPSLDAGHGNSGRKREVGETERALTAVEAYKDEMNILNLAYEAFDQLIAYAEANAITEWTESGIRKLTARLLIQNPETFNLYFQLNSVRMYYTLTPMIREVQMLNVVPVIGTEKLAEILSAISAETPTDPQKELIALAQDYIRRPLALATMAMALQRLNLDVFPDGILQTSVVGSIKEKRVALEESRNGLIQTLKEDAELGWQILQNELNKGVVTEVYVKKPKGIGAGFRF